MKKVLILMTDSFENYMGGMGVYCNKIIKNFINKNYFFYIIGPSDSNIKIDGDNFIFYPINISDLSFFIDNPIFSMLLTQVNYLNEIYKAKISFDLIHSMDWGTAYVGLLLKREFKVPLLFNIHLSISDDIINPNFIQYKQFIIAKGIEKSGLLKSDAILHVSENYAQKFNNPLFNHKTFIIPNGINLSEWKKEKDLKLPGNRPIKVVYIGRFAEMKNVVSILKANIPKEIDIIFIGGNRGGDISIHNKVINESNNKEYFHYVGPKYGQEKVDYLMAADAVIFPSTHEPFGIVGLEALASRSILLASFVDGMKDYLTEDVAINCGTTPETISNALQRLVNMSKDEKQSRINGGIEICKRFSWENSAKKLKFVYDLLLEN